MASKRPSLKSTTRRCAAFCVCVCISFFWEYGLEASFLEIYNEAVRGLPYACMYILAIFFLVVSPGGFVLGNLPRGGARPAISRHIYKYTLTIFLQEDVMYM
jgi:hypothetical protein